MQGSVRRLIPAVVTTALVHVAILAGLLSLRPKLHPPSPRDVLPIVWLERKAAPRPPISAPEVGLSLPAPPVAIELPKVPTVTAPADGLPSPLNAYVTCGLGRALTEDERRRCDKMRLDLYAQPGAAINGDYDLVLEQSFSRAKAVQDLPLLQVCIRRMGPDPLCFVRGFEVLYGSAAARDSIPIPLADPLRPR